MAPPNEVPQGPIASNVVAAVRALRAERRWSYAELSAKMTEVGHPMGITSLQRLEVGRRRVDPDDLVALAIAFDVAPVTLLLPATTEGEIPLTESVKVPAALAWGWVRAVQPITDPGDSIAQANFQRRSLPAGELPLLTHPDKLAEFQRRLDELTEQVNRGEH